MITDPIADYLTRLRNAVHAKHRIVEVPASKMKVAITEVLKSKGFIRNYRVQSDLHPQGLLQVVLKYDSEGSQNAIVSLKRVSKPGLRKYTDVDHIPKVLQGLGMAILSTSQGIMSGKDAFRANVGGEILCYVY